jgi:hypothetical protein
VPDPDVARRETAGLGPSPDSDGTRGLAAGSSLARLLAEQRGVRNRADLPRLAQRQILARADAHRRRTGRWPTQASGAVPGGTGDTWRAVDSALRDGWRGLPGHSSLARLLAARRGVPHRLVRGQTRSCLCAAGCE